MTKTVVLGIGNTLLSDEGVGVHVIEALEKAFLLPPDVEVIDGGTCAMEMLEQLEDLDLLVVVDCVRSGSPPATHVVIKGDAVPVFFKTKLSPHQIGLSDVLASLEFTGKAPRATVIVGIEPASMSLGMELTPAVAVRVPELVDLTVAELREHGLVVEARP
ncbi:HyaD/HybD family hydrogenase maturation endopeptidase [Dechloromonas sp. A34]|uniref:HyaD/HybD family hydrogenase maturation endopeptidase n=1 Tax=Dechloromonas sp. A34 TaxID=447588 RepID=UPI002248F707|nr:HyaD/HybD family hydrogenase maturation endopeptidase [Dechloromonas sp. A34]